MFDTVTPAAPSATDDQRFAAFLDRDRSWRDAFVIGVVTTGVYCRAGCPARAPKRENVRFFQTTEAARATGLRACKRCRPDEAQSPAAAVAAAACAAIEAAETAPSLAELAAAAGLSTFHFHRLFKAETGVTPAAYAAAVKDRRAKASLAQGAGVTEALYDAGWNASSRFYAGADARFGMTPSAWRAKGVGEAISVAVSPCSLGWVLVAATAKGICAIELGDDPASLCGAFSARFAKASRRDDDPALQALVAKVVARVERPGSTAPDLPLDVRGTAFQERVWRALRAIPAGEVWTYGQVASAIGAPKAVRAVGAACGANPVAVATPCHRVVGKSGKLTGYRWGVARKEALLERERG